jgi:hypothetical protein
MYLVLIAACPWPGRERHSNLLPHPYDEHTICIWLWLQLRLFTGYTYTRGRGIPRRTWWRHTCTCQTRTKARERWIHHELAAFDLS